MLLVATSSWNRGVPPQGPGLIETPPVNALGGRGAPDPPCSPARPGALATLGDIVCDPGRRSASHRANCDQESSLPRSHRRHHHHHHHRGVACQTLKNPRRSRHQASSGRARPSSSWWRSAWATRSRRTLRRRCCRRRRTDACTGQRENCARERGRPVHPRGPRQRPRACADPTAMVYLACPANCPRLLLPAAAAEGSGWGDFVSPPGPRRLGTIGRSERETDRHHAPRHGCGGRPAPPARGAP